MNIKTEADADKAGLKHIETEAEIAQLEADQGSRKGSGRRSRA